MMFSGRIWMQYAVSDRLLCPNIHGGMGALPSNFPHCQASGSDKRKRSDAKDHKRELFLDISRSNPHGTTPD